jgi:uncharacterized surface protein with fasciclin (FAS1) repeats
MGRQKSKNMKAGAIAIMICGLLIMTFLSGCTEEPKEPEVKNIVETASANADFETLVSAVVAANLATTLSDEQAQFTVFAPTDAAFAALDPAFLNNLVNNDTANLTKILTYHVVSGKVMSSSLTNDMRVKTVQGKYITIKIENGKVYVDNAMVTTADIVCSNGVIHVINAVIVPKDNIVETAIKNADFETLVSAVVAANLATTLSNEEAQFTVFAPTDAAFAALNPVFLNNLVRNDTANLTKILTYHVVSGKVMSSGLSNGMRVKTVQGTNITITINNGKVYVNDAMVTLADIECSNGVIHVINKVIVP